MIGWVALYTAIAGGVLALVVAVWRGYLRQGLSNIRTLLKFWSLVGLKPLPEVSLDSPNTFCGCPMRCRSPWAWW